MEVTLKVYTGIFTHSSQTALKKAVSAAAQKARAAFESKDMKQAVKDWLFLAPAEGRAKEPDDLLHPGTSFFFWASELAEDMPGSVPDGALAALFYAQKSQKLITEDGPKALALECVGADPAALLSAASQAALDELAYAPAASRYDGDPEDLLLKTLAEKALGGKDQFSEAFTIPINLGQNVYDDLPARFMEYLKAFSYSDALDDLRSSAEKLPETAARPIPRNDRMSGNGSGSGAEINLNVTENSTPTYVQVRNESNGRLAASAFVYPGREATVYIPAGTYRFYYCTGPYWYGEEDMFMDLGTYRKSEPFQARSNHIITYTMGIVKDGNTASYQADPSEFRQK